MQQQPAAITLPNASTTKQPRPSPVHSKSSLKSVSLSIAKSTTFNGTRHERYTSKVVAQFKESMKQVKVERLEKFGIEVATSRLKEDRENPQYWHDLGQRVKGAVVIPARDVSLTIGEIRVDGEARSFLVSLAFPLLDAKKTVTDAASQNTLITAIKGWPKRIERITIEVYTDDFGSDKRKRNKFKTDKKGRVGLASVWLPTEKDMERFIGKVKKDRSNLQEVHLVISARTTAFTPKGLLSKQIFQFTYAKTKPLVALKEITPNAIGTRDKPIDVEDFDETCITKTVPETTTVIDQVVVKVLYEAMLEYEEMMGDDSGEEDSFDETDAEIEAMQERDDEMDVSEDFEEDEDDSRRRPRWVAI